VVVCGDASKLPLESSSVDFVVSFETIEHLEYPDDFVSEVARVLKPGASVAMSSPNGKFSLCGPGGVPSNPFHNREFQPSELKRMLSRYFSDVSGYGQIVPRSFGVCPYWEPTHRLKESLRVRSRAFLWKLLVRLPAHTANVLAPLILKQALYPSAHDFAFAEGAEESAHVFLVSGVRRKDDWEGEG
jgi:SAM-dependent methyltransferase